MFRGYFHQCVSDNVARKNALEYYYGLYMQLNQGGPNAIRYFSDQYALGKEMDENLNDSTWITLMTSEDNP